FFFRAIIKRRLCAEVWGRGGETGGYRGRVHRREGARGWGDDHRPHQGEGHPVPPHREARPGRGDGRPIHAAHLGDQDSRARRGAHETRRRPSRNLALPEVNGLTNGVFEWEIPLVELE